MLADSGGRSRGRKRSAAAVGGLDSGGRGRSSTPAAQKRKVPETGEDDDQSEKKFRKCEKSGCPATYPVCFASASERCARNGYTSRWYHLSCGEHFCNECFDHYYRSHKDGYETFSCWKRVWTSNGKSEPSLKAFMADQQLPYWVRPLHRQHLSLHSEHHNNPNWIGVISFVNVVILYSKVSFLTTLVSVNTSTAFFKLSSC